MNKRSKPKQELPSDKARLPKGPANEAPVNIAIPVVGIGASAGGLEALTELLRNLPDDTGMAFVVVQHLDPHHESRLTELLGRDASMRVTEAVDGTPLEANHVYVIPPNTNLAVHDAVIRITARDQGRGPPLPIDYLFRSLAEDQHVRPIAVVLSGTGSDGTQGVCELKAVGGITFAQDEKSAAHPGMPRSAINSGCIDFILPPAEIAGRLASLGNHPYLAPAAAPAQPEPSEEENYRSILTSIRAITGVDFTLYRDTTVKRRIMRRMALHGQPTLGDYAARLKTDRTESEALYNDLLINVTSFFRDRDMFEALKTSVFPEIADGKSPSHPIRIWVPGCSSGQEAYSLAISLIEYLDNRAVRPGIQIFATDLSDQAALDRARAGVFPDGIEGEVSSERLRRFFRREDHVYRIDKTIRDMCVFARHNVTADPPFSHLDLISCRNVLIYLTTPLQRRIIPMFHYALHVPGFLVLGSAETIGEFSELFDLKDRGHRIYGKKATPARHPVFLPSPEQRHGVHFGGRRVQVPTGPTANDFQKEADRILLGRYAPPGVLVDSNYEILQFRGKTSLYLESPPGEPTTNVVKMAREGLLLELRNALNEARKGGNVVRREGIRVRTNGGRHDITLEVVPVKTQGEASCFLVLFHDEESISAPAVPEIEPPANESDAARELVQLRQELAATREFLQSMIEQQDATNEELRSANEEILSSNEELQSTNEELETAKEELQSTNEELTTVNEQLQRRNVELDHANSDLTNLLTSTSIPVIMVGGDMRLRRITAPAKRVLSMLPSDVGRPISDLNVVGVFPDLERLVSEVIETIQPVEREVRTKNGVWYMMRIHPYRTADNKIDGAVIILFDIDQMRKAQTTLEATTHQLQVQAQLLELSQDAIIVRDAEHHVISWNRGAEERYGWSSEEALGKVLPELLQTDPVAWAALNDELDRWGQAEAELRQKRRDGTPVIVHAREVTVRGPQGERAAVLSIKRDVTEYLAMVSALRAADRRKDEFLAILAHELRNPLAPIRNAVAIMRRAQNDPDAVTTAREMLERQVRQLGRIVEDLIDLARIVEKKIDLRVERTDLRSIVGTAVETCRTTVEGRDQKLFVTLPRKPIFLDADPVRISQVLVNILGNASKYTDNGGEIELTAEVETPNGDGGAQASSQRRSVVVRVRDTGMGIPADVLPQIFDMFSQGDNQPEHSKGGLGVGLALARSLVQMHGGSITAHSDGAGRGSEFLIRLPVASEGAQRRQMIARTPPGSSIAGPPKRVLVVDDNSDQVLSLTLLLELAGHEVRSAGNAEQALEHLAEFIPDIALIDLGLPGMSGYELVQVIKERPELAKVVLVAQTGWGQEEMRRRGAEVGFDHHMVKPVEPDELERIIKHAPKS